MLLLSAVCWNTANFLVYPTPIPHQQHWLEDVIPDHVCYTAHPLCFHALHALAALAGTDRRMCLAPAGVTDQASNMLTTPTMQDVQMGRKIAVCPGHIFIC